MAREVVSANDHLREEEEEEEEEYIDIDLNNSANFLRRTVASPPRPTGFEFRLTTGPLGKQLLTPADELFYKGQLLPLRPPLFDDGNDKYGSGRFGKSIVVTVPSTTAATTPFESCNVSPATSCYVSGELNPVDYFNDRCFFSEQVDLGHPKNSWSKRLKFIRQSTLASKLKASKAYIKSLFTKSGSSNERYRSCVPKPKQCSNTYLKTATKTPFGQIQTERYVVSHGKGMAEEKRHSSSTKRPSPYAISSHSTSFSSASSERSTIPILKRSSSVNSDMESSVQGAIAYCKKSQQLVSSRKSAGDIGFCLISSPKISPNGQDGIPRLCRR